MNDAPGESGKVLVYEAETGIEVGTHWPVDARDIVNQSEGKLTLQPPQTKPTTSALEQE